MLSSVACMWGMFGPSTRLLLINVTPLRVRMFCRDSIYRGHLFQQTNDDLDALNEVSNCGVEGGIWEKPNIK